MIAGAGPGVLALPSPEAFKKGRAGEGGEGEGEGGLA